MSFRSFSASLWFLSVAFLVWIFVSVYFGDISSVPLIGGMLTRPTFADRAAPLLIIMLFSWVLVELAIKQIQVRNQHADLKLFKPEIGSPFKFEHQRKRFIRNSRASQRAQLILDCANHNIASLHETIPAAAALDASDIAATYVSLQVYAWALPVLGFIGTASGMAGAIDGFKDVLSHGQIQVDSLAAQLSQSVIPGLSAAFNTTILGLATCLVTYLCTSALKRWDQEALDKLNRASVILLSGIPVPGTSPQADPQIFSKISDQLSDLVTFVDRLEEAGRKIVSAADALNLAALAATAIQTAANALESAGEESISSANAIGAASRELESASKELQEFLAGPYTITVARGSRP